MPAEIKPGRRCRFNVSIGYITAFPTREGWKQSKIYREFYEGASSSASRHGYKLEEFWLREPRMTSQRLGEILYSRNI